MVHGLQQLQRSGLVAPRHVGILVPPLGTEPTSVALQGGFLTTGPPGKSRQYVISPLGYKLCAGGWFGFVHSLLSPQHLGQGLGGARPVNACGMKANMMVTSILV